MNVDIDIDNRSIAPVNFKGLKIVSEGVGFPRLALLYDGAPTMRALRARLASLSNDEHAAYAIQVDGKIVDTPPTSASGRRYRSRVKLTIEPEELARQKKLAHKKGMTHATWAKNILQKQK